MVPTSFATCADHRPLRAPIALAFEHHRDRTGALVGRERLTVAVDDDADAAPSAVVVHLLAVGETRLLPVEVGAVQPKLAIITSSAARLG